MIEKQEKMNEIRSRMLKRADCSFCNDLERKYLIFENAICNFATASNSTPLLPFYVPTLSGVICCSACGGIEPFD